jgi:hypothetical protein
MARIGGNVGDIVGTAGDIAETGAAATTTGSDASSVAQQMDGQVSEVTATLEQHFGQLADTLRERITATRNRLAGTDWEGMSQGEATRAEQMLNADVNTVLGNALQSTSEFKTFMMSQAGEFLGMVEGEFRGVMGNIDAAYGDLSTASRTFAENLEQADQTIKAG